MKEAVIIVDPDVRINHQIVLGISQELQKRQDWDVHIFDPRAGGEALRRLCQSIRSGSKPRAYCSTGSPASGVIKIPPITIVERASCRAPRQSDPLVDMAIDYLRKEVATGVRVRDLQRLTGLSPHQLVYRFNIVTDRTPMEMILRHRIAVAKQLLAETTVPIKNVARECGFKSATQFFVAFRNQTGVSPSDYRIQFVP